MRIRLKIVLMSYEMLETHWNKFKGKFYKSREKILNLVTRSELRFNRPMRKQKMEKNQELCSTMNIMRHEKLVIR